MMSERNCALILGTIFLALGIAGFLPSLMTLPTSGLESQIAPSVPQPYSQGFGYLFGLFPVNLMHNLVHLSVGLFGIAASTSLGGARIFNRFFAIAYLPLAIMGLLPLSRTLFGYMPIFGNNVWFNALAGVAAAYFGFVRPAQTPRLEA
ncbi:MAG: DUF4383 domain-containing protein [Synechococcales bacterium]|nr:DUF4383 domain-containing protein [Synechococcales bacterium]